MRLKYNKDAADIIFQSAFQIKEFPIRVDKTTYLEIGMGKGQMITQLAAQNPNINYIGCEKYPTVALHALKKIEQMELKNMMLLIEDANKIDELFANKIDRIYLTFSDPWPKKRHAKRRLLHRNFLLKFKNILKPGAKIIFKTDSDSLFDFAIEEIQAINAKMTYMTRDLHNSDKNKDNIMTEYEQKWSSRGKNINYLELEFD
ncbi:tRNA (guanosine(46)-N7)-methyltransferase TrmB [Mycoplasma sp. 128]|uniref:tRNA (guanosine(46)-N7)-methyltransferase TrmB n=1 Tax=Mycoplasma sp. 3341 TaxID=3447506 RepID=UPI003F65D5F9